MPRTPVLVGWIVRTAAETRRGSSALDFAYELSVTTGCGCLMLHGEIDLAVRDELRALLFFAIDLSHSATEVDLGGVTFLDCSGIGVLVAATNTARRRDRALYVNVNNAPEVVRRVVEITGFLRHQTFRSQETPRWNRPMRLHATSTGPIRALRTKP